MTSELLAKAHQYETCYGAQIGEWERPMFHLTPRVGWMNDPNGFSFYKGEYHMFYQYHPYTLQWGPMHWGHAVSRDMLHWKYLPAAMAPDTKADHIGCFSGSAVETAEGKHLLMYTGVHRKEMDGGCQERQTQCLALGDGITYEKWKNNPVLTEDDLPEGFSPVDFRDPKLWRESDGSYACVVGNRTDDGSGAVLLFRSPDGLSWHFNSVLDRCRNEYGKMWECPDFFPLGEQYVIVVSPQEMQAKDLEFYGGDGTMFLVGRYDREKGKFVRDVVQAIDHGTDFYAPQTVLTPDGRRVMVGWLQNWGTSGFVPEGARWHGQLTLPRELTVRNGRICQNPIRELETMRGNRTAYESVTVGDHTVFPGISGRELDMTVTIHTDDEGLFSRFEMRAVGDEQWGVTIAYMPNSGILELRRVYAGNTQGGAQVRQCRVENRDDRLKLRVILDRFSVEVFVNDGEQAMTAAVDTPKATGAILFSSDGRTVIDVEKYELSN